MEKTVAAHHHCLKKEPEIELEPSIERTPSEQLRQAAEQVPATRQESSILAVAAKRRFEAVTTFKNESMAMKNNRTAAWVGKRNRSSFLLRKQC
ncbi:hypothetical protein [Rhodococcus globerulus]|uniref:Uncharacterized protein n=1 Tax=Rhodococcus globerulus TaxID=33008 RepID=A0ABU4C4S8_RHOGO|nr:hypothetical protein [Rhodococcus globerulus]MDV6271514.1 hypothetical protein [Rhodococcus globerulus]